MSGRSSGRSLPGVLAELLRLSCELGRTPTYAELGRALGGASTSTVHDYMVRLRAAHVLRSEPRIAFQFGPDCELARVVLGIRNADDAAELLLARSHWRGAA